MRTLETIKISDEIIIESGPRKMNGVATKELLDNTVTAKHYSEGNLDANGNIIKIGEIIHYLDYMNDFVWYVFKKHDVAIGDNGKIEGIGENGEYIKIDNPSKTIEKYCIEGIFDSKDEAIIFSEGLK